jgi:hypothetical protein
MELSNEGGVAYLDGQGSLVLQPISRSDYSLKVSFLCEIKDVEARIDRDKLLPCYAVLKFRKKSLLRWIILQLLKL